MVTPVQLCHVHQLRNRFNTIFSADFDKILAILNLKHIKVCHAVFFFKCISIDIIFFLESHSIPIYDQLFLTLLVFTTISFLIHLKIVCLDSNLNIEHRFSTEHGQCSPRKDSKIKLSSFFLIVFLGFQENILFALVIKVRTQQGI